MRLFPAFPGKPRFCLSVCVLVCGVRNAHYYVVDSSLRGAQIRHNGEPTELINEVAPLQLGPRAVSRQRPGTSLRGIHPCPPLVNTRCKYGHRRYS